jgi:hypothetical protein
MAVSAEVGLNLLRPFQNSAIVYNGLVATVKAISAFAPKRIQETFQQYKTHFDARRSNVIVIFVSRRNSPSDLSPDWNYIKQSVLSGPSGRACIALKRKP